MEEPGLTAQFARSHPRMLEEHKSICKSDVKVSIDGSFRLEDWKRVGNGRDPDPNGYCGAALDYVSNVCQFGNGQDDSNSAKLKAKAAAITTIRCHFKKSEPPLKPEDPKSNDWYYRTCPKWDPQGGPGRFHAEVSLSKDGKTLDYGTHWCAVNSGTLLTDYLTTELQRRVDYNLP
jgi:hypothetical protein